MAVELNVSKVEVAKEPDGVKRAEQQPEEQDAASGRKCLPARIVAVPAPDNDYRQERSDPEQADAADSPHAVSVSRQARGVACRFVAKAGLRCGGCGNPLRGRGCLVRRYGKTLWARCRPCVRAWREERGLPTD